MILLLFGALSYGQRTDFIQYDFSKIDSTAIALKGYSLENLPSLVYQLTDTFDNDLDRFRAIYTWICTNIENDYNAYLRTIKKRKRLVNDKEAYLEWNRNFRPRVIRKLIEDKKTACTGYSYLVREMARLADIKCEIVDGYGRTPTLMLNKKSVPNHSWNAVQLNDTWYLCDATWSAGQVIFEENVPVFKNDYHDGYFLADSELFVKNHYPLNADWMLLSRPPTFDQFIEGPVVYKEAFAPNIIPVSPLKMHLETVKNKSIRFTLKAPDSFMKEAISLILNTGGANRKVQSKVTSDQEECILEYTFDRIGLYDVHIQYENDIIATYVVKVKRR